MNWYLVKLVFQVVNGGHSPAQFDEQLRLVRADEVAWAMEKASVLGWLEQTTFKSSYAMKVTWKFAGVADIQKVNRLEDGVQLFSTTVQPDCPHEYLEAIKLNAMKAADMLKEEECAEVA
ncbi:MAG: DUF4288 domain-containing protein [Cyclobacteriaceae bacterium]|nr:DUF4288 domain-containing protein [Cyclobacteriaceae bacterium]